MARVGHLCLDSAKTSRRPALATYGGPTHLHHPPHRPVGFPSEEPLSSPRPARLRSSIAASAALALGGGLLAAAGTSAQAEPGAPTSADACTAYPHASLEEGDEVTGLTNTRGTRIDGFEGTYVDTITNGIGRGRDMLVFELSGSRITKDGRPDAGVWAGISGSPVYAADGRLVGAVSYGFNEGNETLAGVPPAEYLLDVNPSYAAPQEKVSLQSSRAALKRQGVSVPSNASLRRIGTVRQVSGFTAGQLPKVDRVASRAGVDGRLVTGGAATADSKVAPLVAGGSIGVTWSYGDITLASVGSVTAVCGDDVYAFGHPDLWDGETSQTMHGASAVGISTGSFGSYKLANVGAPVGEIVQDRLEGIFGTIGAPPVAVDLSSSTSYRGRTVKGSTKATELDELPFITALQAMSDTETAVNAENAGGESVISWKIGLQRKSGKKQTFTRSQRYSARSWLSEELVSDVASDVSELLENPFEDVRITSIAITNKLDASYRAYTLGKVERYVPGKKATKRSKAVKARWTTLKSGRTIDVKPGRTLKLRMTLAPLNRHSKARTTTRTVSFKSSKYAKGQGRLYLEGQAFDWDDYEDYEDFEEFWDDDDDDDDPFRVYTAEPRNLDQMLKQMRATPRQDQLVSTLAHRGRNTGRLVNTSKISNPGAVVSGGRVIPVRFR